MALLEIKPGHKVDVLTQDELRRVLSEFTGLFEKVVTDDIRPEGQSETDANGNATIEVYTVPVGMKFRLERLVIKADGYTFDVPYTGAGRFEVRRGAQVVDGGPLANNVPGVGTDSSSSAARFRNGESVEVAIVGGPANTNFAVLIEGELFPLKP